MRIRTSISNFRKKILFQTSNNSNMNNGRGGGVGKISGGLSPKVHGTGVSIGHKNANIPMRKNKVGRGQYATS